MVRAIYSVRSGVLDTGLFMNGVPAFFHRASSRIANDQRACGRSGPIYEYFDTIGYTHVGGVYGQLEVRHIITGEESLISTIESRLSLMSGALAGRIIRTERSPASFSVVDPMIRLAARLELRAEDREALERSGWVYLDFEPTR